MLTLNSIWILILPIAMFLILGIGGKYMKPLVSGILGTISMAVTTLLSYVAAYQYFFVVGRSADGTYKAVEAFNFEWLRFTEALHIDLGFYIDAISAMMLIVITTVSLMVHIYSLAYMKGEKVSNAIMPSCRCSASRCWGWWLPPTFSRCIFSGSWWAFRPIC